MTISRRSAKSAAAMNSSRKSTNNTKLEKHGDGRAT
jgi:hypothetical protein